MIQPWQELHSRQVADFRVFTVRNKHCVSPRTGATHDFFVIDAVGWVNVVALTPDRKMILVEQFRHGTETVELEIPGGMMDAHEASPITAGCRELLEETGFVGENPRLIGEVYSNPAIMSNTVYTVLIENCRPAAPVEFDATEDLATELVPIDDVPKLVASGRIRHSLVVAALYLYELSRTERQAGASP